MLKNRMGSCVSATLILALARAARICSLAVFGGMFNRQICCCFGAERFLTPRARIVCPSVGFACPWKASEAVRTMIASSSLVRTETHTSLERLVIDVEGGLTPVVFDTKASWAALLYIRARDVSEMFSISATCSCDDWSFARLESMGFGGGAFQCARSSGEVGKMMYFKPTCSMASEVGTQIGRESLRVFHVSSIGALAMLFEKMCDMFGNNIHLVIACFINTTRCGPARVAMFKIGDLH